MCLALPLPAFLEARRGDGSRAIGEVWLTSFAFELLPRTEALIIGNSWPHEFLIAPNTKTIARLKMGLGRPVTALCCLRTRMAFVSKRTRCLARATSIQL